MLQYVSELVPLYFQVIVHCMAISHFIYEFISCWTMICFHFGSIINSAAVNIHIHCFVCTQVFIPIGCTA